MQDGLGLVLTDTDPGSLLHAWKYSMAMAQHLHRFTGEEVEVLRGKVTSVKWQS